jgi:hypothetical protein
MDLQKFGVFLVYWPLFIVIMNAFQFVLSFAAVQFFEPCPSASLGRKRKSFDTRGIAKQEKERVCALEKAQGRESIRIVGRGTADTQCEKNTVASVMRQRACNRECHAFMTVMY